jgi:hypothetical protein
VSLDRCGVRQRFALDQVDARKRGDRRLVAYLDAQLAEHVALHGCRQLPNVHGVADAADPLCVERGCPKPERARLEVAVDVVDRGAEVTCPRCVSILQRHPQIRNALVAKRAGA